MENTNVTELEERARLGWVALSADDHCAETNCGNLPDRR